MVFLRRAAIVTIVAAALAGIVTALWLGPLSGDPAGPGPKENDSAPEPDTGTVGQWGGQEDREPHLSLTEDGRVSGHDGCNGFSGGYTVTDEGTIRFHDVLGTLKGCPGVDTWLHRLASAEVRGDELVVFDSAGEEIGRLPRD